MSDSDLSLSLSGGSPAARDFPDFRDDLGFEIDWPTDTSQPAGYDELLADLLRFENDPLGFAYYAFPWGEAGTVLATQSLEPWQIEILELIRDGIIDISEALVRISIRSGHGIGKSALVSIIILWAMLAEDTRGVVTANSERQLRTKTWAELGKWFNLYIGRELFRLTATSLFPADKDRLLTWRIDMVPWSEHNTTAFQGLHNQGKRILIIFDEASEIPKIIWDTASGATSDANTQIIWFAPGNPTSPDGHFFKIHQPDEYNPWITRAIDARSVSFTNKRELERQIKSEGVDSDFVKIRILGEFPSQGLTSFISRGAVLDAMSREDYPGFANEPVVIGVDVARFGDDESVIYPRQGRNGRLPYKKYSGISTMELVDRVLATKALYPGSLVAVDGGGVGGGVIDRLRQLGVDVIEVQFGAKATPVAVEGIPGERAKYANKRAEIWGSVKDWIRGGLLPDDPQLLEELCAPKYTILAEDVIQLERKEAMRQRGAASPNIADALAITFAVDTSWMIAGDEDFNDKVVGGEYNPFEGIRTFV